jgi:ribosomal protein L29
MDIKELRQKSDKELSELVASLREQLRHFRFEASSDSMKDVRDIRDAKKTLAKALTVSTERAEEAKKIITAK